MLLGAVCVQFHGSITHGVVGTIGDGPGAAPKRRHVHAIYANMLDDLERAKFPPFRSQDGVGPSSTRKDQGRSRSMDRCWCP
jgi:hypothetical protein